MPAATSAITPERQHDALFTETYRTHAPFVRRVVRANLNDGHQHLADDLMQETFLRIYRQHVRLDEVRHMAAFLALAARRTVLDHYKVKRNKLETAVDTGHWTYANRPMTGVGAILTRARTGHEGDSDPDMDEALRRVRQGRQLAVTR
jgi:DNA-directed RNA polymerase specialized sigma24 family protein